MEQVEIELKKLILSRYKSILDFTKSIGMPYSTMDSIFKRGVANANITNIIKICNALGISADLLGKGIISAANDTNKPQTQPTNSVVAITRGGKKIQYDLTETELQAVLTILDTMKKK